MVVVVVVVKDDNGVVEFGGDSVDDENNNDRSFLFPTNTNLHNDTHHSQLGMMGKFTS